MLYCAATAAFSVLVIDPRTQTLRHLFLLDLYLHLYLSLSLFESRWAAVLCAISFFL